MKTLGGLHPVDVILRRLRDDYCDPLELRADSLLGVPGLLQAARDGTVAIANAIGTGVLQTPALIPFLPGLCRALLGEDLKLPSVETWWCGEPDILEHVIAHLPEMVIKPTYPLGPTDPIFGARLDRGAIDNLAASIRAAPNRWVAQRHVAPSTVPVIEGDELRPRPVVLRSFVVAEGSGGYQVMPGALGLVGGVDDADISIARGARSKDTWVISDSPVSEFSLLRPTVEPIELTRGGGDLPSRVADNFFWLGRYAERAEAIARLGRIICTRLAEPRDSQSLAGDLAPLVASLRALDHGGVGDRAGGASAAGRGRRIEPDHARDAVRRGAVGLARRLGAGDRSGGTGHPRSTVHGYLDSGVGAGARAGRCRAGRPR